MKVLTPPMGWNSWNTFAADINEEIVMKSADTLIETGLADCGYNYIVIDDCWSEKKRDENGMLVVDSKKFPHGMKYVADYVHSKGLKFGMYSCAGALTCGGYPASFDHEFDDAKKFAEWEIDFLKYDYCFHPLTVPADILYKRMSIALANCGREILFSACSWGVDKTREWVGESGANMWRSTDDIFENWKSLKELSLVGIENAKYGRMNCFADMDMLVVGMNGKGHVGLSALTEEEYILHFSLWALLNSPLMIGCDIRDMSDSTKKILMNRDVIAINQDEDQNVPYSIISRARWDGTHETDIYAKLLSNGDYAIGAFNFSEETTSEWTLNFTLERLGLPEATGKTLLMTDLWSGEEIKIENGFYSENLKPHECRLYRAKVVDIR